MFKNRQDAASQLLPYLTQLTQEKDLIVIALPRGGVVIAAIIARALKCPLDVIIPRKIHAPFNQELAIGAICNEIKYLDDELIKEMNISQEYLDNEVDKEKNEAKRREAVYRKNKNPLILKNKTVLLVDDGIATGATVIASILSIKKEQPKKIVLSVPVAPPATLEKIKGLVDLIICPLTEENFYAVGQFYTDFSEVDDKAVISILRNF